MPEIHAKGLRSDIPLAYRAALGLLQVMQEIPELTETKLSWMQETDSAPYAVYHTESAHLEKVLEILEDTYRERVNDPRWSCANKKISVDEYRERAREFARSNPDRLAWLRGLATDQALHKGRPVSTLWDFYQGASHLTLLKTAATVIQAFAKTENRVDQMRATIMGEWSRSADPDIKTLNWDDEIRVPAARTGTSISNTKIPTDLPAMVWALESLPFFPVHARGGKTATAGFVAHGGNYRHTWVTWSAPVSRDTVRSLIDHPALHAENPDRETLRSLGVTRVFRSWRVPDPCSGDGSSAKALTPPKILM